MNEPKPLLPQIYSVEASAGSGKTYCLAQRYVQLLLGALPQSAPPALKNILAITFSNKAALEMKERILELLKRIALDRFASPRQKEEVLSELGIDASTARRRAEAVMRELIYDYNTFQVQTIDSFINAILCGCAFKLNLSSGFRIKTDYRDYLRFSVDELIERSGRDRASKAALTKFLNQYLTLENKTGWFPGEDIFALMDYLFSKSNKYSGGFWRGSIETASLLKNKEIILDLLRQLSALLPPATHLSFAKGLVKFIDRHKDYFDLDELSDFFAREDFPVKNRVPPEPRVERLWERIRGLVIELSEAEAESVFNYYIDIFNMVYGDFRDAAGKDDVLFLEELNKELARLFDDDGLSVPELYWRLSLRVKHFLIDEFQDTSRLQWRNLRPMIEEILSCGGTFFCVGDKKQAIYRFRAGDAGLFAEVRRAFGAYAYVCRPLRKNYRSHKQIVEFCNLVFGEDNLKRFADLAAQKQKDEGLLCQEDIRELTSVFCEARAEYTQEHGEGFVSLETIEAKDKEECGQRTRPKMISLIRDLRQRFDYGDIAVLARDNHDVELLTSWLLEESIPVSSEKTLNIKNNPYIKELVSLLKFLNSPIDDLSFASFILGEIFARASGIETGLVRDFIFKTKTKEVYLYREFRRGFSEVWDKLFDDFFKRAGFVSVYELVVTILERFDCLHNFSAYQGFFMAFLELILEQEEMANSLSIFLEYFDQAADDDLYLRVRESDSVKVMTVHKSKGLGFGVVVIPFFELKTRVETDLAVSDSRGLILLRLKEKYRTFSPRLRDIYRKEYLKSLADELNNAYVAFTRAKCELYIFVPNTPARGINLTPLFFSRPLFESGSRRSYPKEPESAKKQPCFYMPVSRYKDWTKVLQDEFVDEPSFKSKDGLLWGEAVHAVLSFIGNLEGRDKDAVAAEALKQASGIFPFLGLSGEPGALIGRLLEDVRCRPFFYAADAEVFQEKEVVDSSGAVKRIDRLVVKDKEVLVIDYKSQKRHVQEDRRQLQTYMRLAQDLYPSKAVKGVLIYLDDLSIEEAVKL